MSAIRPAGGPRPSAWSTRPGRRPRTPRRFPWMLPVLEALGLARSQAAGRREGPSVTSPPPSCWIFTLKGAAPGTQHPAGSRSLRLETQNSARFPALPAMDTRGFPGLFPRTPSRIRGPARAGAALAARLRTGRGSRQEKPALAPFGPRRHSSGSDPPPLIDVERGQVCRPGVPAGRSRTALAGCERGD
jgi:hypothetical protein